MRDRHRYLSYALATLVAWALTVSGCHRFGQNWQGRLAEAEQQLAAAASEETRFYLLAEAAKASVELDRFEKATAYANELLKLAPSFPDNWNYGNAIHDGHVVLGRVALAQGDVDRANEELHTAGTSPGSPQLNSFGPNMSLARDLLAAGERQAVLDYLEQIGAFWTMGTADLRRWTERVRANRTPEFGANLVY